MLKDVSFLTLKVCYDSSHVFKLKCYAASLGFGEDFLVDGLKQLILWHFIDQRSIKLGLQTGDHHW
jgi:hypothetical protein